MMIASPNSPHFSFNTQRQTKMYGGPESLTEIDKERLVEWAQGQYTWAASAHSELIALRAEMDEARAAIDALAWLSHHRPEAVADYERTMATIARLDKANNISAERVA